MWHVWYKILKELGERNPKIKKLVGVILILIGFLALITPFTPGSWLIFVGFGILGLRFALWDKIVVWFQKSRIKK